MNSSRLEDKTSKKLEIEASVFHAVPAIKAGNKLLMLDKKKSFIANGKRIEKTKWQLKNSKNNNFTIFKFA